MVHDIAEGHAPTGSAKPTAPPVPKWPKLPGLGPKGRQRHRGFEAEPEGDVLVEDRAVPGGLRRRRLGQQVGREELTGLEERRVQARHAPS